jgi:uncharacterized membrane protein YphA (DoxX/SURF4 family)
MAPQPQREVEHIRAAPEPALWPLTSRIAFRFCFVYFSLFCLSNQILPGLLPFPNSFFLGDLASRGFIRNTVFWTAAHVFHVSTPLVYQGSGSGDKTFDWVLAFCLLVVATLATVVWSLLDRQRREYRELHKWFYVFLRFAVGSQMLIYGMAKLVPMQMPYPPLTRLMEPFGNFSPMGVLWYSIGASPGYEMFAGSAEVLGGVLLFFPRTALFGAAVCLADTIEVFTLNMTYDVPVKLFAFHLILMSLILLAPEMGRVARFFFSRESVGPSQRPDLFGSLRANRVAFALQTVFGLALITTNAYGAWQGWHSYGGGAPKSPLYGIWNIDPASSGAAGWKRVLFDRPTGMALQKMDDTFVSFGASIDIPKGAVALTRNNWKGTMKFERPAQDRMTLDGEIDGSKVHLQLQLLDRSKLLLVSRGFHWIQEYPFNR